MALPAIGFVGRLADHGVVVAIAGVADRICAANMRATGVIAGFALRTGATALRSLTIMCRNRGALGLSPTGQGDAGLGASMNDR